MVDRLYELFSQGRGVSIDSRTVTKGDLFFALKGDQFNGNAYAEKALQNGADFAIIDEPFYNTDQRYILVEDALSTLSYLATKHRQSLTCPIIGITGTNGKTTTKELLMAVLSQKYSVYGTKGNLNNHIGVPLTLLSVPKNAQMVVVEMGANHRGEIEHLCKIAQPDYGIVTNIGMAHLEGFGSPEIVFKTKMELYDAVIKRGKLLFVNADDQNLMNEAYHFNKCTYGTKNADISGISTGDSHNLNIIWSFQNHNFEITTKLFGSYNIYNVLAAISVGVFFEIKADLIIQAIESYQPSNNRSQIISTTKGNHVILDAYNANPSSMNLALDDFLSTSINDRAVILGEMLELGPYSEEEHRKLLEKVKHNKINHSFFVGNAFLKHQYEFPEFNFFSNHNELSHFLKSFPLVNMSVLVKGSRGNALENIIQQL